MQSLQIMRRKFFIIIVFLLLPFDLYSQLYQYQSKDLRIVCLGRMSDFLVPHTLRCFENTLQFDHKLYGYTPWDQVTILMHDLWDNGNASASTVPRNLIGMGIEPTNYVFETSPGNERIYTSMNHEMTHIETLDQAAPSDRFFRNIFFGKVQAVPENPISIVYKHLTAPRWSSPRWYIEGIAVFLETWNAGGIGRALGGYDEMVFRTRVAEGRELFDPMTVEAEGTAIDFQGGSISYIYGTRFVSYLAYQYDPQKLIQWTGRSDTSKASFLSQFEYIYGIPLVKAWDQWIDFEKQWQRANLDSVKQVQLTPDRPLTQRPLGSISRAFYEPSNRQMYAAIRYPGQVASLVSIDVDKGTFKALTDVKKAASYYTASVAYDPASGVVFFTTDQSSWRDLNSYNIKTGKTERLIDDGRIGDLVFNQTDSSLWGVRHEMGFSTIVRIPRPYTEWNQVYTLPYGKNAFDLDISHDGSLLAAGMTDMIGRQKLVMFDLKKIMAGEKTFTELFDFDYNTPSNFAFTKDDKFLYGSSYYTGVSNIYRYSFETKNMDIMTNCETGYFLPIPYSEDSLIVFRYTSDGFIPVTIAVNPPKHVGAINFLGQAIVEKHPIVTQWKVNPPSPSAMNVDSLMLTSGEYSPIANTRLVSLYPVVEGYKNYAAYGFRGNFSDPVMLSSMDLTLSYTPNIVLPISERLHAAWNYKYWDWTLKANYNGSQFYDLFGPTKYTRKGYSLSVLYKTNLIYDDPRFLDVSVATSGYGGLERLPDYQNIQTAIDHFIKVYASMTYSYFNKSVGAVDDEKGIKAQFYTNSYYVQSTFFPRLQANFDYGIALPIDHSSIWFRSSGGYSFGDLFGPFANFYFGGFGNNWVDYQEPKRYREDCSFPGIELDALGGTNYGKLLFEWALPPVRFRKLGTQDFYCNWARIAVFTSALSVNLDSDQYRQTVFNVGSQIDFRLLFLSSFESTFSLGYAMAFQRNQNPTNEFMISLKLLK